MYNFCDWTPDSDSLELYDAEWSALNTHLETIFDLRAVGPITFLEHGPAIESLVDLLARYLEGNYSEKPVLSKWVDDLIDAAAAAAPEFFKQGTHTTLHLLVYMANSIVG